MPRESILSCANDTLTSYDNKNKKEGPKMDIHVDIVSDCKECGRLNRCQTLQNGPDGRYALFTCEHCGAENRMAAGDLIQAIKEETLNELKRHLSDRLK